MLAQHLRQFARVNARDAWHLLALEPLAEALDGIPMGILLAIIRYNQCGGVDTVALHEVGKTRLLVKCEWRHAIVAHQRKSHREKLTRIGRVGKALRVAHHGSVEHHLAGHGLLVAEALTMKLSTVAEL